MTLTAKIERDGMVTRGVRVPSHQLTLTLYTMIELAKSICVYNGMKGTDKQIERCLKSFNYSVELMQQFATNRIN